MKLYLIHALTGFKVTDVISNIPFELPSADQKFVNTTRIAHFIIRQGCVASKGGGGGGAHFVAPGALTWCTADVRSC